MNRTDSSKETSRSERQAHPPYKATGGYLREEAIMVLRRFYVTENVNGEDVRAGKEVRTNSFYIQSQLQSRSLKLIVY